jgi:hypothetical protein
MLEEFRQRLRDRRGKYSLRKHVSRLRREGRLPQIALAVLAVLTLGGVTFARCEASSITGPSSVAETPADRNTASGSVTTAAETFRENTVERNVVFTGVNPCNGDAVTATGKRHDKFTARTIVSPTNVTIEVDHHINDSFRGEAINNPGQLYTGSDVHRDRFELGSEGVEHPDLTNEHLISQGPAPNWILHMRQKSKVRFDDPLNPTVTFEGHASCPPTSECTVAGGCVDRSLEVLSVAP